MAVLKGINPMKRVSMRVLLALSICLPAWGDLTLAVGTPGEGENNFPFGGAFTFGSYPGTIYQQAYASSDFTGLGPITIDSISFIGGVGVLAPSTYTLSLSTISVGIDTLSDVNFNSNLGPDNTLFASEALSGPAPATLTFTGTPFTYNPANGNLLLNIAISPGGQSSGIFGAYYAADGNALGVFSRYHDFGTATIGYGLVTEFGYSLAVATPEPSAMLPIAFLAAIIVLLGCKRRTQTGRVQRA
jgi:hypothetical protein